MDSQFHPEKVHPTAFIAPTATVVGDVTLEAGASVWFGAVVRGDLGRIEIGADTSIQDGCVIHADVGEPTIIGKGVTLGHGAIVHSAIVADNVLIGMGANVLSRDRIGEYSIVGAGAVVTEDAVIPPRSIVIGVPGRVVRQVTEEHIAYIHRMTQEYQELTHHYRNAAPA